MARVLKITSGLMGVLLLVMVGVMGVGRQNEAPDLMVISSNSPDGLNIGSPEVGFRVMSGYGVIRSTAIVQEGVYFGGERLSESGIIENRLFFMRMPSLETQEIGYAPINGIVQINSHQMAYLSYSQAIEPQLFGLWAGETNPQALTPPHLEIVFGNYAQGDLVSNGSEIAFSVQKPRRVKQIFRVGLDGQNLQPVLHPISGEWYVDFWLPNEDWLIANLAGKLYRVKADGTELYRLTDDNNPRSGEMFLGWLPQERLVIIGTYDPEYGSIVDVRNIMLKAVEFETHATVWAVADADFGGLSPDGQSVLLLHDTDEGTTLSLLDLSDRGLHRLTLLSWDSVIWGWSPDGNWAFVRDLYSLKRVNVHNGRVDKLASVSDGAFFCGWSPDGRWLIYGDYTNPKGLQTFRLRTDGSQPSAVVGDLIHSIFRGWTHLEHHWQPPILAAISLTLMLTPILLSPLRRRFHPAKV